MPGITVRQPLRPANGGGFQHLNQKPITKKVVDGRRQKLMGNEESHASECGVNSAFIYIGPN